MCCFFLTKLERTSRDSVRFANYRRHCVNHSDNWYFNFVLADCYRLPNKLFVDWWDNQLLLNSSQNQFCNQPTIAEVEGAGSTTTPWRGNCWMRWPPGTRRRTISRLLVTSAAGARVTANNTAASSRRRGMGSSNASHGGKYRDRREHHVRIRQWI